MKTWLPSTLGLASLLLLLPSMHAQAVATATKTGSLEAGVGVTYLHNDYSPRHNGGITIWGDYDFLHYFHTTIGADVQLNYTGLDSPDDIGENTYLIGPRFSHRFYEKYDLYGKVLFGRGTISYQIYNTSSSFNVYSFGGGLDYHVARHYNIRGEVDEQKWPNFEPHTLSPITASVGVLYIIR